MFEEIIDESEKQLNRKSFDQRFWIMLAVFYLLFVIRNVLSFEFPIVIYLGWIAVMAVLFNDDEIKGLVISFIPLSPGFQIKYAVLVCAVILVIKYYNRIRIPTFTALLLAVMVWELFHFSIGSFSATEWLRGFSELIGVMVVICIPAREKIDITTFTRILGISSAVAFLILIIVTVKSKDTSLISLIQDGFRFGVSDDSQEAFRMNYNANGLGFLCNITIAALLLNFELKKAKIIDGVLIAFCILVGSLTVSRTFILCLAITVFLYIVLQRKPIDQRLKTIFILLLVCAVALVIVWRVSPGIIENYTDRFSEEDVTGGRSYLFEFYNRFILSSPWVFLFGVGIQDISGKALIMMGETVFVPHNGYQQIVIAWGIIGFVLMFALITCIIVNAKKRNSSIPAIAYLPFVLLLVNIMAGQFVTAGSKVLSLALIYEILVNAVYPKVETEEEKDGTE